MSRNFELLQQARQGEDLFQTSGGSYRSVSPKSDTEATDGSQKQARPIQEEVLPLPPIDLAKEKSAERRVSREREQPRTNSLKAVARLEEIKLVQRIFPPNESEASHLVIFSGLDRGADSPRVCARAGMTLSERGDDPVCVIDGDFDAPSLHRHFHIDNRRGFSEALLESGPIQEFAQKLPGTNLWVIPRGSTNLQASSFVTSESVRSRLTDLRSRFKHVLIHCPVDLGGFSNPLINAADGLVLIVEANATRRDAARQVIEGLKMCGVRVLGVVLNNRTFPIPEPVYRKL